MAQRLGVGASQARLAVGQPVPLAVFPDQGLGTPQVRPRHGGKQVVFDLMVQASEGDVGQPAATDVAGGEHLPPQEVSPVGRVQDRHPLVVGGERSAQVQADSAGRPRDRLPARARMLAMCRLTASPSSSGKNR